MSRFSLFYQRDRDAYERKGHVIFYGPYAGRHAVRRARYKWWHLPRLYRFGGRP